MTTGTIQRPQNINECEKDENGIEINANNILSKNKYIQINPASKLYKVLLEQYKSSIDRTTERPDVPENFCGKITEFNINNIINAPITITTVAEILSSFSITYEQDPCLDIGVPGSMEYTECLLAGDRDRGSGEIVGLVPHGGSSDVNTLNLSGYDYDELESLEWYTPFTNFIENVGDTIEEVYDIYTDLFDDVWQNFDDVFDDIGEGIGDIF